MYSIVRTLSLPHRKLPMNNIEMDASGAIVAAYASDETVSGRTIPAGHSIIAMDEHDPKFVAFVAGLLTRPDSHADLDNFMRSEGLTLGASSDIAGWPDA